MLTLNQTKFEAKLIFTWGGIALGVLIAFVLFFKVIGGFIAGSKPPPPPTVTFGKLPSVVFPQNSSNKSYTYSVDTVTGTLPAFPDRATVYKMTSPKPDLLALQNAKQKMSQAGFMSAPTLIAEGIYQWSDQTSINRKVVIELPAFNFKITSSYLTDPTVLAGSNLPDEAGAKSFTQTFLNNIALFPPDIDATKTATTLYSIRNGVFSSATSLSKSQIVRVDFYQKDVNNIPIFYAHPPFSSMNFFVGGGQYQPQIVQANFVHQSIDETSSATYPILSSKDAFNALQDGNAYVAQAPSDTTSISIKNVSIGYYIQDQKQDYLMPIIVFTGDGFTAYVSAVTDAWINK